jgi:hypothetical protein
VRHWRVHMGGFKPSPRVWLAIVPILAATAGTAYGQIPTITSNGSLGPVGWADGYFTIILNTDAMTIDRSSSGGGYEAGWGCPSGTYTGPTDPDGCARLVSQPDGPDIVVYDFTTVAINQDKVYVAGARPAAIAATGAILVTGVITANNGYPGATVALSGAGAAGSGPGGGGGGQGPGWYVAVDDGGFTVYEPLAGGGGGGGGGAWPGSAGANSRVLIDINGIPNYTVGGAAGLAHQLGYGPVVPGSGGGSGGDRPMWGGPGHYGGMPGGNGGGALILATPGNLTVSGTISVAGFPGWNSNDGGGGGGGGGGFLVLEVGGTLDLQATGLLTAAGGQGGLGPGLLMNDSYGGRGGGGVIHIDAATIVKAGAIDVSGARAGLLVQTYYIQGTRYIESGGIETLAVPFTASDGAVSSGSYAGFIRLNVSGTGVSCTPARNDSFYIYEWLSGCSSPPTVPQHDPNYYQLTFDTVAIPPLASSRIATKFIYFDIDGAGEVASRPYLPAYRTDHTYSFIVDTGQASPSSLHFGVSDGGFGDNSGAYEIRITQLAVAYPLTLLGAGTGTGSVTSQVGLAPLLSCAMTGGSASGLCSELYPSGTLVTLAPLPGLGSGFAGWSGACTGTGTCTVPMSQAQAVTARFDPLFFPVTVTGAGTGSGVVTSQAGLTPAINCLISRGVASGTCSQAYVYGTTVTLTVSPAASLFSGWSGSCAGTGECSVDVTTSRSVAATLISAPTVASVLPPSAPLGGGSTIVITGSDFVTGATVTLGGTPATNVVVVNATTITATTPAHAAGVVPVTVTNPDGQSGSLTSGFAYSGPPLASAIVPTTGVTPGGTKVTIAGTGFFAGATVTMGGQAATNVVVVSSTEITARTPAHAAGPVDVTVTNLDGQSVAVTSAFTYVPPVVPMDFDGDRTSDIAVWQGTTGLWYILKSSDDYDPATAVAIQWGAEWAGDTLVPGDYDGDGRTDLAVWREEPGTWYVLESLHNYTTAFGLQWGAGSAGHTPVPGDYDGDGRTDLAVFQAGTGTWYILKSSDGYSYATGLAIQGGSECVGGTPVPGDYDGDGQIDLAVWQGGTGTWYILQSSDAYSHATARAIQWGAEWAGDTPVPGDYDGDGKTDLAVWRAGPGVWYVLQSRDDFTMGFGVQWGAESAGDLPVPGDYDGDGRADLAVWRPGPGMWYILESFHNYTTALAIQWGAQSAGHTPVR